MRIVTQHLAKVVLAGVSVATPAVLVAPSASAEPLPSAAVATVRVSAIDDAASTEREVVLTVVKPAGKHSGRVWWWGG